MLPRTRSARRATVFIAFLAVAAVLAYTVSDAMERQGQTLAYNKHNLLLLRVVANSDAPHDQELKLKVRDALVARFGRLFADVNTRAEAEQTWQVHQLGVQAVAQDVVRAAGYDYPVRVELDRFSGPADTHASGDAVSEALRDFQTVRVLIGAAAGKNWWCVLFPPLCLAQRDGQIEVVPAVRNEQGVYKADPEGRIRITVRSRLLERFIESAAGEQISAWWHSGVALLSAARAEAAQSPPELR